MTYFELFVAAAWTFVIGWFSVAIYLQDREERAKSLRSIQGPQPSLCNEAQQVSSAHGFAAD
jgi:hypothetical protein